MAHEWDELTRLTGGQSITIERVRMDRTGIAIDGQFEPPPLASLAAEDQVFVAAFVRCHGSIKQMEKYFGVSYPTIKNRLKRIGEMLDFVQIQAEPQVEPVSAPQPPAQDTVDRTQILGRLNAGDISADEAIRLLKEGE